MLETPSSPVIEKKEEQKTVSVSQQAFRDALSTLLMDPNNIGKWIMLHGTKQVGPEHKPAGLYSYAHLQHWKADEYYIGEIVASGGTSSAVSPIPAEAKVS